MGNRRPQKGKDQKRPRAFHRGRAQGRINDKLMREHLEPAYARADEDHAEVEVVAHSIKAEINDHREILAQLARVAPFVPTYC